MRRNGYLQSTIRANIQIVDAHTIGQWVNVTFWVKLGKRARIAAVEIQGPDSSEVSSLLRSTRSIRARLTGGLLKAGKPYTAERLNAALNLIRRTLAQQHRLASSIKQIPPQYYADKNQVERLIQCGARTSSDGAYYRAKPSALPFLSERQMKK